ncbi:MAG: ABC transporter permease subunit [Candidatus Sumerlaeota bacterium]|nr:ABC transporter permease subunit [Candidatus Sumerlaeota bacterium]
MFRISFSERIILHGVLIAGAIIFSFPFCWLLLTSVKPRREMASEHVKLWPKIPRPRIQSPYIDPDEYQEPERPEGVPEKVWAAAKPMIAKRLGELLDSWRPQTIGPDENPAPAATPSDNFRHEMIEGLFDSLRARASDEARGKALAVEKELRAARAKGEPLPGDNVLVKELSEQAIREGAAALLRDANRLADETMRRQAFDNCYRRLALGQARIRTKDYVFHRLYTGKEWKVMEGPATLIARYERTTPVQEARIDFKPGQDAVAFELVSTTGSLLANNVDRVYIGYRPDDTWADVQYEVIRDGQIYRTHEKQVLAGVDPLEVELRWKRSEDPMQKRAYYLLEAAGPAPQGSPSFAVRMRIEKTSAIGAWYAKITQNYRSAFREVNFPRYIATSFALSILNIILAIFSCTLVAYAFARLEWPGRDLCFGILLATMMIPGQVTMIPSFLVNKWLGWYNTLLPLWVGSAFGSAFFIFLLRQFFKNIPKDLEDAARIDGCGFLRIYWHVMLPLVKPTIATIAIFTFMGVWNNFMGPLIYLNDERLFPLALGLFKFNIISGTDVGLMMAGSFIMTMPIIILFFFVQRYFIQGVSLTGIKG